MEGTVKVIKGHGTENDFVVLPDLDGLLDLTPGLVRALCDRHAGIGADGVLRVVPAPRIALPDKIPCCPELFRGFCDRDMQRNTVISRDSTPLLFSGRCVGFWLRGTFPTRQYGIESSVHPRVQDHRDSVQQRIAKIGWVHAAIVQSRSPRHTAVILQVSCILYGQHCSLQGAAYHRSGATHHDNGLILLYRT